MGLVFDKVVTWSVGVGRYVRELRDGVLGWIWCSTALVTVASGGDERTLVSGNCRSLTGTFGTSFARRAGSSRSSRRIGALSLTPVGAEGVVSCVGDGGVAVIGVGVEVDRVTGNVEMTRMAKGLVRC